MAGTRLLPPVTAIPGLLATPGTNSFHISALDIRLYALGHIVGTGLAILIMRRRWRALGGGPDVINDIALRVFPAGIIGGRIYFRITTLPTYRTYGTGPRPCGQGLGIWGGAALATSRASC